MHDAGLHACHSTTAPNTESVTVLMKSALTSTSSRGPWPGNRLESSTSATSSGAAAGGLLPVPVGKQPHLVTPSVFFNDFDRALPALKLRGVQAAQMQHRRCNTRLRLTRRLSHSE